MDKTKAKLAAFFDDEEDSSSFPQKVVDNQKLTQYTTGTARKSKREKEKDAADAKKREEEENAAKAYAEFLDEFETEDRRKTGGNFVKAESSAAYTPVGEIHPPTNPRAKYRGFEDDQDMPVVDAPKAKGKRAMDSFLEEIKKEQQDREDRYSRHAHGHGRSVTALAAYDGQVGSKDRGDPATSNVFVANLPQHVTEQTLGNFFARVGPVGSVKVMWPRTDVPAAPGAAVDPMSSRRPKSSGLSGFVSYMRRKDAEAALREFDGFDWGGSLLRVGWSKAVPVAAKPLYGNAALGGHSRHSHSRSPSRERRGGGGYRSRSRSRSPRRSYGRSRHDSRSPSRSPRRSGSPSSRRNNDEEETVTDTFIRAVAAEVKSRRGYGENLRERERNNPKYAFLVHKDHRRHAFYKGLLEVDRVLDPEFDDDGYNSVYSTDSAEDSERERSRRNILGKLARRRFESMLRAVSGKRGELARCMAFSLEHAEAAHEVADIIVASLLVDGTAVPRKVARLHLICDILHNSAASLPSAWKFRQEFQSRLGIVFDHLATIYHSFPGRITAETFKKQITSVIDIWEDWIVFPPDFTAELRARLEGAEVETAVENENSQTTSVEAVGERVESRFKASSFQPASVSSAQVDLEDLDGVAMNEDTRGDNLDGAPMVDDSQDDLDGAPMDDDVDGAPMEDYVDGAPMNDDVDGAPMEDDLDGAPM